MVAALARPACNLWTGKLDVLQRLLGPVGAFVAPNVLMRKMVKDVDPLWCLEGTAEPIFLLVDTARILAKKHLLVEHEAGTRFSALPLDPTLKAKLVAADTDDMVAARLERHERRAAGAALPPLLSCEVHESLLVGPRWSIARPRTVSGSR